MKRILNNLLKLSLIVLMIMVLPCKKNTVHAEDSVTWIEWRQEDFDKAPYDQKGEKGIEHNTLQTESYYIYPSNHYKLMEDILLTLKMENYFGNQDNDFTIDLNGHTLTASYFDFHASIDFGKTCDITLMDSSESKSGKIYAKAWSEDGTTLNLQGGSYYGGIHAYGGDVIIDDGNIYGPIEAEAYLSFYDGKEFPSNITINNATVNVTDESKNAIEIKPGCTLVVEKGTFTTAGNFAVNASPGNGTGSGKPVSIKGGTFTGKIAGLCTSTPGGMSLSGGTFTSSSGYDTNIKSGIMIYTENTEPQPAGLFVDMLANGYDYNTDNKEYKPGFVADSGDPSAYRSYVGADAATVTIDELKISSEPSDKKYIIGSKNGYSVTSNGNLANHTGVVVDRNELTEDQFTAVKGSTIITLLSSYLDNLDVGSHDLKISFASGSLTTSFEIVEKSVDPAVDPTPEPSEDTSDKTPVYRLPKTGIE